MKKRDNDASGGNEEGTMSAAKPRKTGGAKSRKKKSVDAAAPPTEVETPVATSSEVPGDPARAGENSIAPSPAADGSSQPMTATTSTSDEDEIRRRAYELYVSRGGVDGNDLLDWLEAERLVRGSRHSTGAKRSEELEV
jgi:hypothetical protein